MWPTAIVAVDAQRDGGQKEVTDPYAILLGNERSNLAESARASGEARLFQGRESVDGLTAPPLAQKTGNVQELLCPEQTQSLKPLAPIDGSASQVHILTETSSHNCEFGPPAVTEPDAVEDSSRFVSNDSEATTPVATRAVEETGVYSNSGLGSSIIIMVNKSEGAPYPVTSSVAGNSICAQGGNGDTNVTIPVAGTEHGIQAGQWASSSYENSAMSVCEKTSDVEHRDRESCCREQWKHPDMENLNDCCAARRGSISSEDGMLSLGPAVSVNVEREVCELPVERTAETGYEVDQSDSQ